MPSPPDFNSLVAALVEHRDRAAFAQLFDYFVPRLQSHLIRLGTDSAQAEEITQDVMVTLWHKAHLFDSQKSALPVTVTHPGPAVGAHFRKFECDSLLRPESKRRLLYFPTK